jgi:osmoprotectant transport system substrate-binding protein
MKKYGRWILLIGLVIGISVALWPHPKTTVEAQDTPATPPIRVGSKPFAENEILAQFMMIALQEAGFATESYVNLGITSVVRGALVNGQIDVYPEYTGTALGNFFLGIEWAVIPDGAAYDPYLSFSTLSMLDAAINDLVWLQPAPANNTFGIAVTQEFAEANDVRTMSEWADYVNDGGTVFLVASEEFILRPDGLPSFEKAYGFELKGEQMLSIVGVSPTVTEQALDEGVNGVNAAMVYSTDGTLESYGLVVLEDTLQAQPLFYPTPVFRGEIIRAHPEIIGILNPIFAMLDNTTLQGLNRRVEVDGESAEDVARAYLQEHKFIE